MALSRSFKISLLLSALIHAGAFAALDREPVAQKILAAPKPLVASKPKPKVVRFEMIDTPASAETPEPPKKTDLISDKNTRAQDKFKGEKKLEDSPHMEGRNEDSKDTRPKAVIAQPLSPPKPEPRPEMPVKSTPPEKPSAESTARPAPTAKKDEPAKLSAEPEKEQPKPIAKEHIPPEPSEQPQIPAKPPVVREKKPSEPPEKKQPAPEPKEGRIIRLAKKAPALPEPAAPSPAVAPRGLMSSASVRNTGGDAKIAGELSFAATRHFFGEYLLGMKQRVEAQWISRLVSRYTSVVRSRAVIDFKIQPDGKVTDVNVDSTEGDLYFALICISSIRDAQPFDEIPYDDIPGLPEEFKDKPLSIRFTFRHN